MTELPAEHENLAAQNLAKLAKIISYRIEDGKLFKTDGGVLNEDSKKNIIFSLTAPLIEMGLSEEAIQEESVPTDLDLQVSAASGECKNWKIKVSINTEHDSFRTFQTNVFAAEVTRAEQYVLSIMANLPASEAARLAAKITVGQQALATSVNAAGAVKEAVEREVH